MAVVAQSTFIGSRVDTLKTFAALIKIGEPLMACHGNYIVVEGDRQKLDEVEDMLSKSGADKTFGRTVSRQGALGRFLKRHVEWDSDTK